MLTELVKPIAGMQVVQRGITVEDIAIAVPLDDQVLLSRITVGQAELDDSDVLRAIRQKWLGTPAADQSSAVH